MRATGSNSNNISMSSNGGTPTGTALSASALASALVVPHLRPLDELHQTVAELNREVDDKQLVIHELLGQGAYGVVYRGEYGGLVGEGGMGGGGGYF